MTEKRFHKGDWNNIICEVYDGEEYIGGVQLNCADEFIDLLNSLNEENERLKQSNKLLRMNRKDCEKGRIDERKSFEKFDKSRVEHIRFLQKRLKENGLSIYRNE